MKLFFSLMTGMFFGLGLSLGGMTNPAKVINFFDIYGTWDPSLVFVMGGAMGVTFIGYRLVWRRRAPLLAPEFQIPTATRIDKNLVQGAALFGVGWGLSGFCPGGAIAALGSARWEVALFLAAMLVGHFLKSMLLKPETARA